LSQRDSAGSGLAIVEDPFPLANQDGKLNQKKAVPEDGLGEDIVFGCSVNLEQFDLEDKRGVRCNFCTRAARAVGEFSRDEKLPLVAFLH
jgi:hypothetical protein